MFFDISSGWNDGRYSISRQAMTLAKQRCWSRFRFRRMISASGSMGTCGSGDDAGEASRSGRI
ncbi:hypothetical protein PBRA_005321 [Plasmodiophora brassicae]|uniref:Uncharacterized protein n=1 Tax=Plasmodiophora brassicae TaxID=37360 RepID=A0A0G4INF3_PLABS|nr:hypothetical protein PBRA_005321 [Plasmodiophora brassicae]